MEVVRDGVAVALPPSRKTRALLAYLAVSAGEHRRERLCSLLWDVADDPRGALRWSLSKLRAIVDEPGCGRIAADRESVSFRPLASRVDFLAIRERIARGVDHVPAEELEALAAEFRGEFLEGLDLSDFHQFHAWCVAMREDARKARVSVLEGLVRRLGSRPGQALPYARALVQADPFSPEARAHLLRLLAATGRLRKASDHYESARRILAEAGPAAVAALAASWDEIRARSRSAPAVSDATAGFPDAAPGPPSGGPPAAEAPAAARGHTLSPLVGREAQLARLRDLLDDVAARRRERTVLIFGEPGIGKSRLLAGLYGTATLWTLVPFRRRLARNTLTE